MAFPGAADCGVIDDVGASTMGICAKATKKANAEDAPARVPVHACSLKSVALGVLSGLPTARNRLTVSLDELAISTSCPTFLAPAARSARAATD